MNKSSYNKNNFKQEFYDILYTKMRVIEKQELLMKLILKLDEYNEDILYRKTMIINIQKILDILDNIIF